MKFVVLLLTIILLSACKSGSRPGESPQTCVFRLKPGVDLAAGIEKAVRENNIVAGWVVAGVGSLTDYSIRFANQPGITSGKGHFEIVSLTGTVSVNGSHLHLSISDGSGSTLGGHLVPGCKIYTTAEIVLQSTGRYVFTREKDGSTPWEELQVKEN